MFRCACDPEQPLARHCCPSRDRANTLHVKPPSQMAASGCSMLADIGA